MCKTLSAKIADNARSLVHGGSCSHLKWAFSKCRMNKSLWVAIIAISDLCEGILIRRLQLSFKEGDWFLTSREAYSEWSEFQRNYYSCQELFKTYILMTIFDRVHHVQGVLFKIIFNYPSSRWQRLTKYVIIIIEEVYSGLVNRDYNICPHYRIVWLYLIWS